MDIIIYIILREVEGVTIRPGGDQDGEERRSVFRFLRVLRPAFIICSEEKQSIRRAFRNIYTTVPDILSVLLLLISSILLFGLMAMKLFGKRDMPGAPDYYFKNYWDSFYDLYVLMTTANSPDVYMPAYNDNDGWMIFFMVFIILDTYIFMNLFLAVIYNNYKQNVKRDVSEILDMKEEKLRKSFRLLQKLFGDVDYATFVWLVSVVSPDQSRNITGVQESVSWVFIGFTGKPAFPRVETEYQWLILADDKRTLKEDDFLILADLFSIRILEKNPDHSFSIVEQLFPRFYNSRGSLFLIQLVRDDPFKVWFMRFFDVAILANAICIGLDFDSAEWFFLSLFCVEIAIRMYAYGFWEFFSIHRMWNWFDFIIIFATVIATIVIGRAVRPLQ